MKNRIRAFTLAEVLITLTIIALIAVVTYPVLKGSVGSKVSEGQISAMKNKLTKGFQSMKTSGDLAKDYQSTEEFVEAMQKHMSIARVCKDGKLSDCFASEIKKGARTVKYRTDDLTTTPDLGIEWPVMSSIVGVVFADKTTALVAYNTSCILTNIYDVSQLNEMTKCVAMIYDVNGTEKPNIIGDDIFAINVNLDRDDNDDYNDDYDHFDEHAKNCVENCDQTECNLSSNSDCRYCGDHWSNDTGCVTCFGHYGYSFNEQCGYNDYNDYYDYNYECFNNCNLWTCGQVEPYSTDCGDCAEGYTEQCPSCFSSHGYNYCNQCNDYSYNCGNDDYTDYFEACIHGCNMNACQYLDGSYCYDCAYWGDWYCEQCFAYYGVDYYGQCANDDYPHNYYDDCIYNCDMWACSMTGDWYCEQCSAGDISSCQTCMAYWGYDYYSHCGYSPDNDCDYCPNDYDGFPDWETQQCVQNFDMYYCQYSGDGQCQGCGYGWGNDYCYNCFSGYGYEYYY